MISLFIGSCCLSHISKLVVTQIAIFPFASLSRTLMATGNKSIIYYLICLLRPLLLVGLSSAGSRQYVLAGAVRILVGDITGFSGNYFTETV